MPKEVFSATLGNITIYTAGELKKLLSMPEGELKRKLQDGSLRAEKVKDAWYVPDEVIAEQRKLSTRIAAAGGRASKSQSARNLIAASTAALFLLITGIAAYNIFGPEDIVVEGCDSPGLERLVMQSISGSQIMPEIVKGIKEACSEEGLSGDSVAYQKCITFMKAGLVEAGELEGVTLITESETGISCAATLEAVASFRIEYTVTLDDAIADHVSVSLR